MKQFFVNCWLLMRCFGIVGWRSFVVIFFSKFSKNQRDLVNKYMRRGAHSILRIFRAKYSVKFKEPLLITESESYIFMSNHQSLLDLPLIFATIPYTIRMLAKQELFEIPIFGKAITEAEFVPIDRHNPNNAAKSIQDHIAKFRKGFCLWVFPEGTRTHDGNILPFKPGVFRLARELGAKIIPVGIAGTGGALPPNEFNGYLGKRLNITVGSIIDAAEYNSIEQQKIFMQRVSDAIGHLYQESKSKF